MRRAASLLEGTVVRLAERIVLCCCLLGHHVVWCFEDGNGFVHQKYWYHQSKYTKATTFVISLISCDMFRPDYSTKVRDRKTKHCLCVEVS